MKVIDSTAWVTDTPLNTNCQFIRWRILMRGIRAALLASLAIVAVALSISAFTNADISDPPTTAQGLAAWDQVYSVLISPRCINCHTATNYPQQGDDRHRHVANIVRSEEYTSELQSHSFISYAA